MVGEYPDMRRAAVIAAAPLQRNRLIAARQVVEVRYPPLYREALVVVKEHIIDDACDCVGAVNRRGAVAQYLDAPQRSDRNMV